MRHKQGSFVFYIKIQNTYTSQKGPVQAEVFLSLRKQLGKPSEY